MTRAARAAIGPSSATLCPAFWLPPGDLGYEIFNLGRGEPVTMYDFVAVLEKLIGKPARWKDAPLPPTDLAVTFADTAKAHRMLGYSPQVSVEEGLATVLELVQGSDTANVTQMKSRHRIEWRLWLQPILH